MAPRSKVLLLPEAVRQALEQRLLAGGFSGYEALTDWLGEQGYAISKSALHRFGSAFEERCQALKIATDQARAIVEGSPDDDGAMSEALMRLTQQKLFDVLLEINVDPETIELPKLARAIADMSRSTVTLKRYRAEVHAKVKAVASDLQEAVRAQGMSEDQAEFWRKKVLGIV
jgi:hypothetical protein